MGIQTVKVGNSTLVLNDDMAKNEEGVKEILNNIAVIKYKDKMKQYLKKTSEG